MAAAFHNELGAAWDVICLVAFAGATAYAQLGQGVDPRGSFFAGASLLGGG